MEFDYRTGRNATSRDVATHAKLTPGKRTLTEQLPPIQRRQAAEQPGAELTASATTLPAPIQQPDPAARATMYALFSVPRAATAGPAEALAAAVDDRQALGDERTAHPVQPGAGDRAPSSEDHTAASSGARDAARLAPQVSRLGLLFGTPEVHRSTQGGDPGGGAAPEAVISAARGSGAPLPAGVRTLLEPRLNHDFGNVRVHTDAEASAAAGSIHARAYTVGSDIVFGDGQFQPDQRDGQHLLAHELVHVVQQAGDSAASGPGAQPDTAIHLARTVEQLTALHALARSMSGRAGDADGPRHIAALATGLEQLRAVIASGDGVLQARVLAEISARLPPGMVSSIPGPTPGMPPATPQITSERPPGIAMAGFTISRADDPAEHEAERVADAVMDGAQVSISGAAHEVVHRSGGSFNCGPVAWIARLVLAIVFLALRCLEDCHRSHEDEEEEEEDDDEDDAAADEAEKEKPDETETETETEARNNDQIPLYDTEATSEDKNSTKDGDSDDANNASRQTTHEKYSQTQATNTANVPAVGEIDDQPQPNAVQGQPNSKKKRMTRGRRKKLALQRAATAANQAEIEALEEQANASNGETLDAQQIAHPSAGTAEGEEATESTGHSTSEKHKAAADEKRTSSADKEKEKEPETKEGTPPSMHDIDGLMDELPPLLSDDENDNEVHTLRSSPKALIEQALKSGQIHSLSARVLRAGLAHLDLEACKLLARHMTDKQWNKKTATFLASYIEDPHVLAMCIDKALAPIVVPTCNPVVLCKFICEKGAANITQYLLPDQLVLLVKAAFRKPDFEPLLMPYLQSGQIAFLLHGDLGEYVIAMLHPRNCIGLGGSALDVLGKHLHLKPEILLWLTYDQLAELQVEDLQAAVPAICRDRPQILELMADRCFARIEHCLDDSQKHRVKRNDLWSRGVALCRQLRQTLKVLDLDNLEEKEKAIELGHENLPGNTHELELLCEAAMQPDVLFVQVGLLTGKDLMNLLQPCPHLATLMKGYLGDHEPYGGDGVVWRHSGPTTFQAKSIRWNAPTEHGEQEPAERGDSQGIFETRLREATRQLAGRVAGGHKKGDENPLPRGERVICIKLSSVPRPDAFAYYTKTINDCLGMKAGVDAISVDWQDGSRTVWRWQRNGCYEPDNTGALLASVSGSPGTSGWQAERPFDG